MTTVKGMKTAEAKVARAARDYPTLFGTNEHARMKVLTHMFTMPGGGYEWWKGNLCDLYELRGLKRPPREKRDAADARLAAEADEVVPHLFVREGHDYLSAPLAEMPADVKPAWRQLGQEVLWFYLSASQWHFYHIDGLKWQFSCQIEWDGKAALRKVEARLVERFPDWPRAPYPAHLADILEKCV